MSDTLAECEEYDEEEVERAHNTFRNGRVHVMAERCKTCVFRNGNLMYLGPGGLRYLVEEAKRRDSAIICHSTLPHTSNDQAVCRGFFDAHETTVLQLAKRMGVVAEVPVESLIPESQ